MDTRVVLQDAPKKFTADQDKILTPEETVKRFRAKLNDIDLDILQQTVRIDNGRLDIPVFFSVCGRDARSMTGTKKQMGKGATPAQSEASAVMELAERFSFFTFCKNPNHFFTATYADLKHKNALPFEMIAKSVHDTSNDLEHTRAIFENLPLEWTQAYNLTQEREVLIPFNWFFTINEFNGPSAGNCVEEALSQGICEIVERHTSSLVSHQKLKSPHIDPNSVKDQAVVEMLKKYRKAGITLYASDFTLDMGIPTVGVMAYDPTTFPQQSEIVWTAGTTPCPEKAFSRALTEVAQLAGDFNSGANYVASGLPKYTSLEQADYVRNTDQEIPIQQLPNLSNDNIKIEVQNLLGALARRQMDVIVINTMHPQLQIPAFYTIIPGAHFRERALGTSVGMFAAKIIAENQPPAKAVGELLKIEQQLPGKYYVQFYIGYCLLNSGDPEAALNRFERSLEMAPNAQDVPSIYSYMGVCLKEMEKYRQALRVLSRGAALDQERTDIHNLMGFCHFKLKEHEKAIDAFKQVLRFDPSSAIDYANIASNYRDLGDTEKAIQYYQTALELDPTIEFARDNLARLGATQ